MHSFKVDKGTQALNFFAIKEGGKINKMKAIKLIWLADRYHLRKYGRPITDDNYKAMPYGPVPSSVKDIAQNSSWCGDEMKKYANHYIKPVGEYYFKSIADLDEDVFSDTDLEALKFAYDIFGRFNQFKLAEISHAYPEWKRYEDTVEMSINDMSYLDFFEDPNSEDPNLKSLLNKDPFQGISVSIEDSKTLFKASKDLERMWY